MNIGFTWKISLKCIRKLKKLKNLFLHSFQKKFWGKGHDKPRAPKKHLSKTPYRIVFRSESSKWYFYWCCFLFPHLYYQSEAPQINIFGINTVFACVYRFVTCFSDRQRRSLLQSSCIYSSVVDKINNRRAKGKTLRSSFTYDTFSF